MVSKRAKQTYVRNIAELNFGCKNSSESEPKLIFSKMSSAVSERRPSSARRSTVVVPYYAAAAQPQVQEPERRVVQPRMDERMDAAPSVAPVVDYDDDMEQALGLPDAPVDGRRVIRYEKGPNSEALSIATAGVMEDKNIRFIQYERVTKEIHYMKPKSDRS